MSIGQSITIQMVGERGNVRTALANYVTYSTETQAYYDNEIKPLVLSIVDKNTGMSGEKIQVRLDASKWQELDEAEQPVGDPVETFRLTIESFPYEIV